MEESIQEEAIETTEEGSVEETVEMTGELGQQQENFDPTDEETNIQSKLTFGDRAEIMGLTPIGEEGCYHYSDIFCEVVYRTLQTRRGADLLDNVMVSPIALFTKSHEDDSEFLYVGIISPSYKFEGNEVLINKIIESIAAVGSPIFSQTTLTPPNFASIRHEIVIQNITNVPQVGDIYPQLTIRNSYDGTKAAHVSFGLAFNDGEQDIRFSSREKLGYLRQVHIEGSPTTMQAEVGGFVELFGANIGDMVVANFNNQLTQDDMMKVLDMIEKLSGKKRREAITAAIVEDQGDGIENWSMNSWQLFHSITRFSTLENNLNAKRILEDIAERVLIVPAQMSEAVVALQESVS